MNSDNEAPIYKPEGDFLFYCDFQSTDGDCSNSIVGPSKWKFVNTLGVKELNKKWKNLRQCYKRELDSQSAKSGSAKKKKTQYVYFDVLSFLAPVFNMKTTHSNVGDAENGDENEEGEMEEVRSVSPELGAGKSDPAVPLSSAFSKRKRDRENGVADVCQLLKRSLEERMAAEKRKAEREETDDDLNFLMSLLNFTRAVKGMNKLSMRTELLQVVTKYYNMSVQPQNFFSQSSQQPSIQQVMRTNFPHPQYSYFTVPYPSSHSFSYSEPPFPTPVITSHRPSSAQRSHSADATLTTSPLSSDLEFSRESSNF